MPDTPFANIEPWTVPTDDPRPQRPADETLRRLEAELARLREELRAARRPSSRTPRRPA